MPTAKKALPESPGAEPDEGKPAGRMSGGEFARLRSALGKSQRELAELLGLSLKAVESYEQGWRKVPGHVERMLYFLLFKLNEDNIEADEPCWQSQACPDDLRSNCVAYAAKAGNYCWFFTGRLCASAKGSRPARGSASGSGSAKKPAQAEAAGENGCYTCSVFTKMLDRIEGRMSRCL
jgi:hypothetical protein